VVIAAVVLVAVVVGAAIYLATEGRRSASGGVGPVAEPARTSPPEGNEPRREFYMAVSQEREVRLRLYSLDEYRKHLGGDADDARNRGMRLAMKAYTPMDRDWYDLPPERAARDLGLGPTDYEVDGAHGALLLRRLPRGLPAAARDALS
jgi:hypothetical protein